MSKPDTLLKKRTTRPKTISMQFEELWACLNGQYTGINITGARKEIIAGDEFKQMLATARIVRERDSAGRRTNNVSTFYVLDIP